MSRAPFSRATIVGGGLAGLSSAVQLTRAGLPVALHEGARQAGGRCRSYHDSQIGKVIDNGNHLVLSGNGAVARFRATVGATTPLAGPDSASFAFHDLRDGSGWTLRMNEGPLPWWVAVPSRRVPGTRLADYAALAKLMKRADVPISSVIATHGPLWERLLDPVLLAVLNTPPGEGSLRLTANVLRETIARGGKALHPCVAVPSLAEAFINPALGWLASHGARAELGQRLRALTFEGDRVASLDWGQGPQPVAPDEAVILAVPSWVAQGLVPGLSAPDKFHSIVNAHYDFPLPAGAPPMLGLLGGTAEWVFGFDDRVSVTISAADHLVDSPREEIAQACWNDICRAFGIAAPLPAWQVVKEKRATFSATPEQDAKRPPARTAWRNLFLAGDWTATGLPATIEGALRSGETAAALVMAR